MCVKYSVGYSLRRNKSFVDKIVECKVHIDEVYFSWGDFPNGRNSQLNSEDYSPYEIVTETEKDLERLCCEGLRFNVLFNGNCYGDGALSRSLFTKIGDTVDYLGNKYNVVSVTTTSPVIAKFIKANFPELDVRASVNMAVGSTEGMDYVSELFDSFYLKRELNRDLGAIKRISEYCEKNGKKLHMLANSGCLNNCTAHTFHDNLVAHETGSSHMDNAYEFVGLCHEYISKPENRAALVRNTNFVRPEDIHLYEKYFASAKLATRVNPNPTAILGAYVRENYSGAVTDLLEPSHTAKLYPYIIDNSRFPKDFAKTVMTCGKHCEECGYCAKVYENSLVYLDGDDILAESFSDEEANCKHMNK